MAPLLAAVLAAACSRGSPMPATATTDAAPSSGPHASLGNVMADVARRFEIAGRAAKANRFELAQYEAGEIEELFESDVPGAEMPKEGPTAHIPAMARAFLESNAPELRNAAASGNGAAFAAAFERASVACNACHQASGKGFIHIPSEPGRGMPDLDPLPSPVPAAPARH